MTLAFTIILMCTASNIKAYVTEIKCPTGDSMTCYTETTTQTNGSSTTTVVKKGTGEVIIKF